MSQTEALASDVTNRKPVKQKVLLVDDDSEIVQVLGKGLTIRGFEVTPYSDPVKALEHFEPNHFDTIVTDISMPGMDGFQLYYEMRKRDPKVRVIFLTAYENYEPYVRELALLDRGVSMIRKPIDSSTLARVLDSTA